MNWSNKQDPIIQALICVLFSLVVGVFLTALAVLFIK